VRKTVVRVAIATLIGGFVCAVSTPAMASIAGRACDFNGDGRSDLAVGAPGESVNALANAGSVNVLYGTAAGLSTTSNQIFHQATASVAGVAEAGDSFGSATACGDFNNDGRSDLAVGVPHESVEVAGTDIYNAGAVNIFYGSASGLTATGSQIFTQSSAGVPETAERGDEFGWAVTAGDFDGDGRDDLAIGAHGENTGGANQAGTVNVLYGSATGLNTTGSQDWNQGTNGVEGDLEGGDAFGSSLASGDFNNDGRSDLVVGSPGEDIVDQGSAGTVNVLYGTLSGLSAANDQIFNQSTTGIAGNWESGDLFGHSVAAGDFNGDNRDDLAVGVPGENDGDTRDAGAVNVIYSAGTTLSVTGNHLLTRNSVTGTAPMSGDAFGTALAAADYNGNGRDDLAIGTPGAVIDAQVAAGQVITIAGSLSGLNGLVQTFSQGVNLEGATEAGDQLGSSLGAGDFNGDGRLDLAIGAPGEAAGAQASAGAINVINGTVLGLTTIADQIWTQN
jgi:hypothetical protein